MDEARSVEGAAVQGKVMRVFGLISQRCRNICSLEWNHLLQTATEEARSAAGDEDFDDSFASGLVIELSFRLLLIIFLFLVLAKHIDLLMTSTNALLYKLQNTT